MSLPYIDIYTSSTAQGGGGSFRNRKPIGEVGCCESRMAERIHWWTERCLRSPLFLSLSLNIYLPTYLSMYLYIYHLSISLSHLITYLPIYLSTYLPIYLSTYLPIYLSTYLAIYLSIYQSINQSIYQSIYLSLSLSVYLPAYLQAWKRSTCARLPQCLNLTTSKTKQFCETSSIFELDSINNSAKLPQFLNLTASTILRDFLNFQSWQHQQQGNSARLPSKMESWVQSWRPRSNAFCDFSTPPVKSTAPATKKWCQVIRSAAPVTQNHLSKPEDLMLQNATPLRESAPGPPNSSDEHVSCNVKWGLITPPN